MFTLLIASMAASALIGGGTTVKLFKVLDDSSSMSDIEKVILDGVEDATVDEVTEAE